MIEATIPILASIATHDVEKAKDNSPQSLRRRMIAFESAISQMPNAKFGDDACALKHHFGDDLYIREMTGLKGMIVVTKLHKTTHPFFVIKGDISILTENGIKRIKAPYFGLTKAGTKRIGYFHEDTIWITVHSTKETDLEKIEEEIIANSYEELPERVKALLGIEGGCPCLG